MELGAAAIILLTSVITVALFAFVIFGGSLAGDRLLVALLMVVPICGVSSLSAVVSVYASEIYPTHMRARGGGLAAGSTKLGGLVVVALVSSGLATPSTQSIALIGAASMTFASILALSILIETRSRRLEQLAERESLHTERR